MDILNNAQIAAVEHMKNGCILCGGVGSGKSRTALAYYFKQEGGDICEDNHPMHPAPRDLYIITTARKRDTHEWDKEMDLFHITRCPGPDDYHHSVVVDSWNNISKYTDVKWAFFIFDEQRLVGSGTWVKSFYKIAKSNDWILLSATPGDCWLDYIPVFVANGFYKNQTQFKREHVMYSNYAKFPQVTGYLNEKKLRKIRDFLLVDIEVSRHTVRHDTDIFCSYDISTYKALMKTRWNIWENKPIDNAAELCYSLRRVVNASETRQNALLELLEDHEKVIIFYNFDYELEILRTICGASGAAIGEWNGHKHEPIPACDRWVYLVQYTAGCEGWNCVLTDTIIFYSQNYSYKVLEQAHGRIDRINTPFTDLYYYHLKSRSGIDLAISKAIREKKKFNEGKFVNGK